MKKIYLVMSAVVLFALCGCSNDGMTDTYWRDDKTGEWLIGFTDNKVIYDCKVWEIFSQEEYERLKDYDIVYMYLANTSPEESWKNVIREYNVTGKNVAHYNLPDQQEQAVESYIGVHGYPTYKLVDPKGNLHDLSFPLNVDEVEDMMKRMLK